jgi:hypothetical protein
MTHETAEGPSTIAQAINQESLELLAGYIEEKGQVLTHHRTSSNSEIHHSVYGVGDILNQ